MAELETPQPGQSAQSLADAALAHIRDTAPEPNAADDGAADSDTGEQSRLDRDHEIASTEAGAAETPPSADDAGTEAVSEPPIEPPASWNAQQRAEWSTWPRSAQESVRQRETARDAELARAQNAAAEARKASEGIAAERQRMADQLAGLAQHIQILDPVLAEGSKTDWPKLARDNPADYVVRKADYDQRVNLVNAIQGERQRLAQEAHSEKKREMVQSLRADDELGLRDNAKWEAFDRDVTNYLIGLKIPPERIAAETSPLAIKIAHKAMLYDRLMAERRAIEAKKTAPTPRRVLAPGAGDTGGRDARLDAAHKAALRSGNARRMADAALALVRANPNPQ